jgi:glycosyltransferase involved in cell wall biosynthesis
VIIGDGELWDELHREVERRGMSEMTRFTGWRADLPAAHASIRETGVPSLREQHTTMSRSPYTAGRAVIGTRVGGMPDIITPGVNGVLVPSGDADALAAAISDLIVDPARRAAMGDAGRRMVLERHGADRMVAELKELYRKLLAQSSLKLEPV